MPKLAKPKSVIPKNLLKIWRDDPLKFQQALWPHVQFFDKQRDMIMSVRENKETIVVAGNMLGKDFTAAFIVLWYFICHYRISRERPWVRIITTSVKADHLRVLWAEIVRFISRSKLPLLVEKGGPLLLLNMEIRHESERDLRNPINYLLGQVSAKGEGMSGHHAENGLLVIDEASGVEQIVHEHASEWADKLLIFGNPNPCNNFFIKGVKAGDQKVSVGTGYDRKIIKIRALDSPNVKLALLEKKLGRKISLRKLVPGVMPYDEYIYRRKNWDKVMQCIKLDAEFYEGAEVLLCPPEWLNLSEAYAATLTSDRAGTAMGIDTAEGGDNTVWSICDNKGLIKQISMKTPDTAIIGGKTIALMQEYRVPANKVMFDQGGGGQEHADYLRAQGHHVKTVSFGEAVAPDPVRHLKPFETKQIERRERYTYKNRRAHMYYLLRQRLNPYGKGEQMQSRFGLPVEYVELRRQLAPLPMLFDEEGKVYLPPKRKKPNSPVNTSVQCLEEILGCSPDEADSLVLAVYAMDPASKGIVLRPMW